MALRFSGTETGLEIWVDDSKPAPDGCAVARTYDDALRLMSRYNYTKLYLDHDLGEEDPNRTGYDLLKVLMSLNRVPPVVECISWNPAGRKRIEDAMLDYKPLVIPPKKPPRPKQ